MTFLDLFSFVLICVYICLVRPLNKQRRRMFRACTASSAAFIATSYMPHMQQRMGPSLEAVSQSPKVNNTLVPQKAKEDPKVTIVTIKAPKDNKEDEDLDFWHTRRLQPPSTTQPSTSTSNTSPNLLKNSHLTPIIDHVNNETSNTSASSWSVKLWRLPELLSIISPKS